jgi:hypothetical protein
MAASVAITVSPAPVTVEHLAGLRRHAGVAVAAVGVLVEQRHAFFRAR